MTVKCRKVQFKDMKVIIKLLKSISNFIPNKSEYKRIWKKYSAQNKIFYSRNHYKDDGRLSMTRFIKKS